MKGRVLFFTVLVVFTVCAAITFAQGGRYTRPVSASSPRSTTIPVSTGQRSYVSYIPESTYINTNRVITGNVPGDRHFRGTVPYSSVYEFQDDLGSDDLNSFIRRSAGVPYRGSVDGSGGGYYLPSKTVTSLHRGRQSGLESPEITFAGGTGRYALPALSKSRSISSYYQKRPASLDFEELEKALLKQPELMKIRAREEETRKRMEEELSKFGPDVLEQKKPDELEEDFFIETPKPIEPTEPIEPAEPVELKDTDKKLKEAQRTEIIDELGEELIEEIAPVKPQQDEKTEKDREPAEKAKSILEKLAEKDEEVEAIEEPEKFEDTEYTRAKAKEIRGKYETFAQLSDARFKEYIEVAGEFIKEGRYYMAADAYSLAEVYKPRSVEATAGMAHSLFAAGEYMSSAFFVRRALRQSPEYINKPVKLGDELVDRDMIENRIIELQEWAKKSKAAELSFLLAYIHYRNERVDKAREFIAIVVDEMGDSPAVVTLKEAIDNSKQY